MQTPADWHTRYTQQAGWTRNLRDYLFPRAGLANAQRVLEVGCGTGVLTREMHTRAHAFVTGVDIQPTHIRYACKFDPQTNFLVGDGLDLPFSGGAFDLAYCHFLLLWVRRPEQAISEMARVVRPGGWVLALAEPDYGGRIDYPTELSELGRLQAQALTQQGADPQLGRKLAALFSHAGLKDVQAGVLGGEWRLLPPGQPDALEWQVIAADLGGWIPAEDLNRLQKIDAAAIQAGERIVFVPTFYAIGKVE